MVLNDQWLVLEIAREAGHLLVGTFDRHLGRLHGAQKLWRFAEDTRMADRKYRQQGYRSPDALPRRREPPAADAPRSGGMLATRTVSRCAACGAVLPIATASLEQCPNCRAAIHACRQCTHFDTARRFECALPVPERLADKSARNDCASFSLRVTVERDASPDSTRPADIRRGFDNLFKT